jgi:hypothetical protein
MIPDPLSIATILTGVAGCLAAVFCLLALRKSRSDFALEASRVRGECDRSQVACLDQLAELKVEFATLELSMQNTEELLWEGRLNRTSRAQAMQLMRTGVSPETAASTLRIAKREMNLLSKVLRSLSIP